MKRQVVLVNEKDEELGTADIFDAHKGKGLKHRALSVILYRVKNGCLELLLQKRSGKKPIFKHLWSNTCCTNLRPGDEYLKRAVSRLKEEMGISLDEKDLKIIYRFSYEAPDLNRKGWCENELDTVIVGRWDGEVVINKEEAEDYRWMVLVELKKNIEDDPEIYAPWYKMILKDERFWREVE